MIATKLTVSQKQSEKFSKLVRKIYIDWKKNHGTYIHRNEVYVIGNSNHNQKGVMFHPLRVSNHRIFIITEVDEQSNLVATYIVPSYEIQKRMKWVPMKYSSSIEDADKYVVINKEIWMCTVNYADILKYEDNILLDCIIKERENI